LFILDHRSCLNQIISRLSFKTLVLLTTWTNFFLHLMCELIQLIYKICLLEIINTYKIFLDLVQRPIPKLISNHTPLDAALASWFFLLGIIYANLIISLTQILLFLFHFLSFQNLPEVILLY
jgi:hypothetical protein